MMDSTWAARLQAVFELSPTILTVTGLDDGRIVEVNNGFLLATGYARDEVIGRSVPEIAVWVDPGQREAGLAELRAGRSIRNVEARFRAKDGSELVALANADVVVIDGRRRVLTALIDISDRVRAETALREGEPAVRNGAVDITERKEREAQREARREEANEFLAVLSHELRNPLGAITNALGVMDGLVTRPELQSVLGIIGRQTTRLTRLVDDLLDVARATSGKIALELEPVDLRELAERCVHGLRDGGRAREHRLAVEGDSIRVHGDRARLEQVMNHLLDNALKYTAQGGEIRVTTERAGGDAVLRVRDTVEGIGTDLGARVFDVFGQAPQALDRARGGLGLGLALVKQLVELHGGTVSVTSRGRGHGSEFTVRLPAFVARPEPEPTAMRADPGAPRGRRILIVEDNADAREGLRMLLTLAGHEVETSEDALDGLEKLRTFRPEFALIDIGLPGVDGYALARMARQTPETRVTHLVALTGYGQAEDRQRALAAGFDTHMTKPVDPGKLCAFLTER